MAYDVLLLPRVRYYPFFFFAHSPSVDGLRCLELSRTKSYHMLWSNYIVT